MTIKRVMIQSVLVLLLVPSVAISHWEDNALLGKTRGSVGGGGFVGGRCLVGEKVLTAPKPVLKKTALKRFSFQSKQMGTRFTIIVYALTESIANKSVKAAFQRIDQLNMIFSDYEPDSEVSQLGKISKPGKPVKVSRELWDLLKQSVALSKQTNGAFDVTVGHFTHAWRMARWKQPRVLPSAKVLAAAKKLTGFRLIRFSSKEKTVEQKTSKEQTVELLQPKMRLDFGGIAKGYAVDEAVKVLRKHGLTRVMVDGGGDLRVGDPPPGRDGWRIAVFTLQKNKGMKNKGSKNKNNELLDRLLLLKNKAVATSGDAYRFVEINGQRYSHIVDPKTGIGLTMRSSVTVIAPTAIAADSLASAVSVLGPQKGKQLVQKTANVEALIVQLKNGELVTTSSCGFADFLMKPTRSKK